MESVIQSASIFGYAVKEHFHTTEEEGEESEGAEGYEGGKKCLSCLPLVAPHFLSLFSNPADYFNLLPF